MFSNTSGVLFFGVEGAKPVAWNAIPKLVMDESSIAEEQNRIIATMTSSQTATLNCHINKKDIEGLMNAFNPKPFKPGRGPKRKRMIRRARKMQTNYIYNYTFRKKGDEYVYERGQVRLVLQ